MDVFYLSTSGGYADRIILDESMTIENFVSKFVPNTDASDYFIRVNERPVNQHYILKNDDRIIILPLDELAMI